MCKASFVDAIVLDPMLEQSFGAPYASPWPFLTLHPAQSGGNGNGSGHRSRGNASGNTGGTGTGTETGTGKRDRGGSGGGGSDQSGVHRTTTPKPVAPSLEWTADDGRRITGTINRLIRATPVRSEVDSLVGRLGALACCRLVGHGARVNVGTGLPEEARSGIGWDGQGWGGSRGKEMAWDEMGRDEMA